MTESEWIEKVRLRSYELWERAGRTGDPDDHWYQAEKDIGAQHPRPPRDKYEPQEDGPAG